VREAPTLADEKATATIAVKDLGVARRLYADPPGLEREGEEGQEALTYRSGDTRMCRA
jgi:hypothetical protein